MFVARKVSSLVRFCIKACDVLPRQILDKKVDKLFKESAGKDFSNKIVMSFEEFKQKKFESLEDYTKRKKVEYPHVSEEELAERHHNICSSTYRTYKRIQENPSNNPGLILGKDFFEG